MFGDNSIASAVSIGSSTVLLFCICGGGALGRLSFLLFVETSCLVTFWLLVTNGLACTLGTNCVLVARFSVACERL